MILGFAHITRNQPANGQLTVPNAPEKWPLMERQATWHSLRFDTKREEVVEYDTGVLNTTSRLRMNGRIVMVARNAASEIRFFQRLGFETVGWDAYSRRLIHLDSRLPDWQVAIAVERDEAAPIDPPLDIDGYAALAFYSSNVEADRDKAIAAGGRTPTDPFTIKLDREMKIIMLRSPEGTIIELIEVLT